MTVIAANSYPPLVLDCRMDVSISIQHTIFCFLLWLCFSHNCRKATSESSLMCRTGRDVHKFIFVSVKRRRCRAPACSQGTYYSFSNKPHNINNMCTYRLLWRDLFSSSRILRQYPLRWHGEASARISSPECRGLWVTAPPPSHYWPMTSGAYWTPMMLLRQKLRIRFQMVPMMMVVVMMGVLMVLVSTQVLVLKRKLMMKDGGDVDGVWRWWWRWWWLLG